MKKSLSSAEGDILHEVKIDLKPNNDISAINFVLKVYISYSQQLEMLVLNVEYVVDLKNLLVKFPPSLSVLIPSF